VCSLLEKFLGFLELLPRELKELSELGYAAGLYSPHTPRRTLQISPTVT
jgi:hypothetical protein